MYAGLMSIWKTWGRPNPYVDLCQVSTDKGSIWGSLLYSSGERVEDNSMLFVLRGEVSFNVSSFVYFFIDLFVYIFFIYDSVFVYSVYIQWQTYLILFNAIAPSKTWLWKATSHCHLCHRPQLQLAIMGIEVRRIGAGRAPWGPRAMLLPQQPVDLQMGVSSSENGGTQKKRDGSKVNGKIPSSKNSKMDDD